MDYTVIRPPVALKAHKLTLTQGHQEKWIQKSCLSFEEECKLTILGKWDMVLRMIV